MNVNRLLLVSVLLVTGSVAWASDPPGAAPSPATASPAGTPVSAPSRSSAARAGRAKDTDPKDPKDPAGPARDRLELDATAVTGSRELPKVLVIVPWKRADLGDLVGKPLNSLVDEALQPLDREVFRREVAYHATLATDRPASPGTVTGR
jgi:hypothetical protein